MPDTVDLPDRAAANLRGGLQMTLAMFGFAASDLIVKSFAGELDIGQMTFLRGLFASVIICFLAVRHGARLPTLKSLSGLVLLRALSEAFATYVFLTALFNMPVAKVAAILQFLPLTVTLGAALIFGEKIGWRRMLAILIGFAGVMAIIRPGLAGFDIYALYALAAVGACTLRDLATRRISGSMPSIFVTAVSILLVTCLGGILSIWEGWKPVSVNQLGMLAFASAFILVGQNFVISAMRTGEIGFVSPFRYSVFVFAALGGFLFYDEIPDGITLIGTLIVVSTGIFTLYRENYVRRQGITTGPARQ